MIGRRFSHYQVVAELGTGGMGTVYRAEDTLLGRPVALKFPHRALLPDSAARARFLHEARIASVLDHPHIVVLYDVCEEEGEIFLAMQCIDGPSVRERLRAGAMALDETLAIGRAVADALAHAHGRGIVHRDIKPENILLTSDGRAKVADFGVARVATEDRSTQSGAMVGSLGYIAPEVLLGRPAEARSDLYSLGVVLYELCAGHAPFRGEPAALLYQVAHAEPEPLPPAVPVVLRELIGKLLSKAPEERLASAVEVADVLLRAREAPSAPERAAAASGLTDRSLAVLFFENLTGNPDDDYFCAGITEDLLTDVLKISDLKVASRGAVAQLRGRAVDARQAGRTLGVATVLEGGVRRAGGRVRVNARLVRADTGYQMWADRYDRDLEDIFDVQDDISRKIAAALRLVFEPESPEARLGRRTKSPRAYDLRLQALAHYHCMEEDDMRRAIALLEEGLRDDPDYALGRAELAECYVQLICKNWAFEARWLDRAEVEARRALELAPSLPEAYRALGHLWMHRSKPHAALRDFHHATELDPRFADAAMKLSNAYLFVGDASRAEVYIRRAISITPESPRYHSTLGEVLLRQRRMAECREASRQAIAMGAGRIALQSTLRNLLLTYAWDGDLAGARGIAEEASRLLGARDGFALALRAEAEAFAGETVEARRLLESEEVVSSRENNIDVLVARTQVLIGDRGAAIARLEHGPQIVDFDELRTDPQLSTLLGEPRFERLLAPLAS